MKAEIECRLLNCDENKIITKLEELGATFIGDWLQMRYCYDFKPIKDNSWIRLRTNGETTTLTIKEIASSKIDGTKESEIIVSDFNETDEILNKLGYVARSKQENRRIQFKLDGVEVDIDFWPQIPTYVEFEAESEQDIVNVCNKLQIDTKQLTTMDVSSIYKFYGKNGRAAELVLEEERKRQSFINAIG